MGNDEIRNYIYAYLISLTYNSDLVDQYLQKLLVNLIEIYGTVIPSELRNDMLEIILLKNNNKNMEEKSYGKDALDAQMTMNTNEFHNMSNRISITPADYKIKITSNFKLILKHLDRNQKKILVTL